MLLSSQQAILLRMCAQSPTDPIALRAAFPQLQTTTLLHIALITILITLVLITVAHLPFTRTAVIRASCLQHMLLQNHLPHQKDVGETRNLAVTGQLMVDRLEDGKRIRYLLPTGACYWSIGFDCRIFLLHRLRRFKHACSNVFHRSH